MAVTVLDYIGEEKGRPAEHLKNAIRYILNPRKTEQGLWVGGNVGREYETVLQAMLDTKREWQKLSGRQGYHFKISFKPGETDEKTAFQLVRDFCEQYLGDDYDYCFAIHNDKPHLHGHIIFNSVNRVSGYKYRYIEGDWEKEIQPITDSRCREYGLPELVYDKANRKRKSYAERLAEKEGRITNKMIIRADIDVAIQRANDFEAFLRELREMGYVVRSGYSEQRHGEYMALIAPGAQKARRDYRLGTGYTVADIRRRLITKEKAVDAPVFPQIELPVLQPKGQLQVCALERVRQAYYYRDYDRQLLDQNRVRKDLLKIEQLRNECVFLIENHLETIEEVQADLQRTGRRLQEERNRKETVDFARGIWSQEEQAVIQEYQELQRKLQGRMVSDEAYEAIDDRFRELKEKYPETLLGNRDTQQMRIQQLRQRRNILRRILRNAEETLKVVQLQPKPQRARNRAWLAAGGKLTYRGKEKDER